jgi:hypothetical protein
MPTRPTRWRRSRRSRERPYPGHGPHPGSPWHVDVSGARLTLSQPRALGAVVTEPGDEVGQA